MKKAKRQEAAAVSEHKVPPTFENAAMCICMQCPVEAGSQCSKKKMETIIQKSGPMPKGTDIPKLYCSLGTATCKDLDSSQMCICGDCPVWGKYGLGKAKPSMYFCLEGEAR